MSTINLPPELMISIFGCVENDYNTLHSCVLVNKQWHSVNIPALWRNPFYSAGSTKILINCLLLLMEENKNFLKENNILLPFKLLEKPPLYNYAKLTTELNLCRSRKFLKELINGQESYKLKVLNEKLANFILDHSANIKRLKVIDIECDWLINHNRFDTSFKDLCKLDCNFPNGHKFFDKIAKICKKIQELYIDYSSEYLFTNDVDYGLTQLVKAQDQIKRLSIRSADNLVFSDDFKKAISIHSESIIDYDSVGENNLDSVIIPTLKNLNSLSLINFDNGFADNSSLSSFKSVSFKNIVKVVISLINSPFLLDLSSFIKINGKFLNLLIIEGYPIDVQYLGEVIQLVGENCHNLTSLSIFYKDEVMQYLVGVFNNCVKLQSIALSQIGEDGIVNADEVLAALNQALPRNLRFLSIAHKIIISDDSLGVLMNNWQGSKPLELSLLGYDNHSLNNDGLFDLLKEYQDLGFLKLV